MASVEPVNDEDGPSAPKMQRLSLDNIDIDKSYKQSLPSVIDGFKLEQRKVINYITKQKCDRFKKVGDLADSVIYYSSYEHDKPELCTTIVNMTQNNGGFKNISILKPILKPLGDFGSKLGEINFDSPCYVPVKLSPITRLIFNFHDEILLTHEYSTIKDFQPVHYLPVIPMILVNGEECMETDPPTIIPSFNPRDIVKNILRMLDGEKPLPMQPWYKNFKGTIQLLEDKYVISGVASVLSDDTIEITELPIGTLQLSYISNVLDPMLGKGGKKAIISNYQNNSTDDSIRITVKLLPGELSKIESEGLNNVFKLEKTMPLNLMNALNENNCVRRYKSVEEIFREFYRVRMKYYVKRKAYFLGLFRADIKKISNQARFLMEKCDGDIVIENKEQEDVIKELKKRGYCPDPVKKWLKDNVKEINILKQENIIQYLSDSDENSSFSSDPSTPDSLDDSSCDDECDFKTYNYILGMTTSMLTEDGLESVFKKRDEKVAKMNIFRSKTECDMWREDLTNFINGWDTIEQKGDIASVKNKKRCSTMLSKR